MELPPQLYLQTLDYIVLDEFAVLITSHFAECAWCPDVARIKSARVSKSKLTPEPRGGELKCKINI